MSPSSKHIPDRVRGYRWLLCVGVAALLLIVGCVPLTRGDIFSEIDDSNIGGNRPPVAVAGLDQIVSTGNLVNLDGSGSFDPDSDPMNYQWTFLARPVGSVLTNAAIGGAATAAASFTPDVDGTYTLQLQVDDSVDFSFDSVNILASSPNLPPVAVAGLDLGSLVGALVGLDGSASSDPDLDILSFTWSFLSVPVGSILTNTDILGRNTDTPSFTPDVQGDFVLQLAVSDGLANDVDEVTVSVHPPTLVGEWMFSGGMATDTGPYGYDGTVNAAVPIPDRAGNPNSALYFDGAVANVVLGNGPELNHTDLISFSCWFRSDDFTTDFGRLVSKRSSPVPAGWEISIGSTDKISTNRAGTINAEVLNPGMAEGVWHHLAFTWDPTAAMDQIKLYLDGVYLNTATLWGGAAMPPPVSAEPLTLGMAAYASVSEFKGAIDDVRYYHRILTPAEVADLAAEPALP